MINIGDFSELLELLQNENLIFSGNGKNYILQITKNAINH